MFFSAPSVRSKKAPIRVYRNPGALTPAVTGTRYELWNGAGIREDNRCKMSASVVCEEARWKLRFAEQMFNIHWLRFGYSSDL